MSNEAEELFEYFCADIGVGCDRVPTASAIGERRPDFQVRGCDGTAFFAEVKQVVPNAEEVEQIRQMRAGKVGSFRTEPGAKVRGYIAKANGQLRGATRGEHPGLLVILNKDWFLRHHTEPYAILTAMRGLDVIPVLVPSEPHLSPEFQTVRSGPKKRMTSDDNTSISAVLTLRQGADVQWAGDVFHNRFAACPLPFSALVGPCVKHYIIRADERGWDLGELAV